MPCPASSRPCRAAHGPQTPTPAQGREQGRGANMARRHWWQPLGTGRCGRGCAQGAAEFCSSPRHRTDL